MTNGSGMPRADAVRDARLTWTIGGSLLAASAVFRLLATAGPGVQVPVYASEILWAGALVILAFGVRGHGSIVGRKPFAITVLSIAAVIPLVTDLLIQVVMASVVQGAAQEPPVFGSTWSGPSDSDLALASAIGEVSTFVTIVVPILAGVVIGRARILPRRWRWAPLVVLALVPAVQVLGMLVVAAPGDDQQRVAALIPIAQAVTMLSTVGCLLLGVLAIVYAKRAARPIDEAVPVYPPTE
jgi:hypothetical protein